MFVANVSPTVNRSTTLVEDGTVRIIKMAWIVMSPVICSAAVAAIDGVPLTMATTPGQEHRYEGEPPERFKPLPELSFVFDSKL